MTTSRPAAWWDELARRITERTGFVVRERDVKKLDQVIDRELQRVPTGLWGDYLRLLDSQSMRSPAWQGVLNYILIGETYMFRHTQQYDFLAENVLNGQKGPMKCWSAGCATGEEAFTLSIVFQEKGHQAYEIVASDISLAALRSAATGKATLRKGVHEARLAPWTQRGNDGWYVVEPVRSHIKWEWCNLVEAEELVARHGPFDVIMCRNVLIYFDDRSVEKALEIFDRALAPDGWLVLGHAESLLFRKTSFRMVADGLAYTRFKESAKMLSRAAQIPTPAADRRTKPRPELPPDDETPEVIIKRAVSLEQQNRIVEAAHLLRKLLQRDKNNMMARLSLSGIYRRSGQIDAAEAELIKLSRQLDGRPDDEPVAGGDGLTIGALRGFVTPYAAEDEG